MEFHGPVQCIGRSSGRSAVACIAYRTGGKFYDQRYQLVHDYSRKRGVECVISAAPEDAPEWVHDPEKLWNAAEAAEKKKNATVARELELALPAFLSLNDRREIVEEVAAFLVEEYGVAVTAALHEPSRQGDQRNFHAHIMFTTREIDAGGFGKKTRVLDDLKQGPKEINKIRHAAADIINEVLKKNNSDLRVDPRSFKERGIDKTPQQHLGPIATEIERDGRESHRGKENREIERSNAEQQSLKAELAALDKAIEAERERISSPARTPEDAIERLEEDKRFYGECGREANRKEKELPPDRMSRRERMLLFIARTTRSLFYGIAEKFRALTRERDKSQERRKRQEPTPHDRRESWQKKQRERQNDRERER